MSESRRGVNSDVRPLHKNRRAQLRREHARDGAAYLIEIERFADDAGDQINFAARRLRGSAIAGHQHHGQFRSVFVNLARGLPSRPFPASPDP